MIMMDHLFEMVAYCGSSLVCYSVTYLEHKSACRVVYAIPLSHISDIRELAIDFFGRHSRMGRKCDRNGYFEDFMVMGLHPVLLVADVIVFFHAR